jgi:hypothetical protein
MTLRHLGGQRAESRGLFKRTFDIRSAKIIDKDKRIVEFTASSEYAADRWGEKEILSHDEGAIRLERLRAVGACHTDHDPTKPVAAIDKVEVRNKQLVITARFGRTAIANDAWMNVEDGIYRGVSAMYAIHKVAIDEDANTYTATDWEPYEVSFTTIPVDPTVGVGRADDALAVVWRSLIHPTPAAKAARSQESATMDKLLAKFPHLATQIRAAYAIGLGDDQVAQLCKELGSRSIETADESADESADEGEAAAPAKRNGARARQGADAADVKNGRNEAARIVRMAKTLGLDPEKYLGSETVDEAFDAMQRDYSKGKKEQQGEAPIVRADVIADGQQKAFDAASDALLFRFQRHDKTKSVDNDMRGRSVQELATDVAMALGHADAYRWTKQERAMWALGIRSGMSRRSAMYTSGHFVSYVLANYADKALLQAFNAYVPTYNIWAVERFVEDFKSYDGGDLDMGVLTEKAEGIPYPLMSLDEAGYVDKLGLFGGTIAFTLQAMVNDDLGAIDRKLGQTGTAGAQTMDREAYKKLMGFDYTAAGSETLAAPMGAAGNIDKARRDMAEVKGPGGVMLGKTPRYLIHPAGLRETAIQATQMAPGATVKNANTDLVPVNAPLLNDSSIDATNASASTYYLAADPASSDTVVVSRLTGWTAPRAFEKDGGATAQRVFLILLPLRATHAGKYGVRRVKA